MTTWEEIQDCVPDRCYYIGVKFKCKGKEYRVIGWEKVTDVPILEELEVVQFT